MAPEAPRTSRGEALPRLTGFENHGGVTTVGTGARPLAHVVRGVGNGGGDGTEGAWSGRVIGSYLHGPLLARNPAVADVLLAWAVASSTGSADPVDLGPLDDTDISALRAERFSAVERLDRPEPGDRLRRRGWPRSRR